MRQLLADVPCEFPWLTRGTCDLRPASGEEAMIHQLQESNNPKAQYVLALLLADGFHGQEVSVPPDPVKAISILYNIQEHVAVQKEISRFMLFTSCDVDDSIRTRSLRMLQDAAAKGTDGEVFFLLSKYYLEGAGDNAQVGQSYLDRACELRNPEGLLFQGIKLKNVSKLSDSLAFFSAAAQQGIPHGCYYLAEQCWNHDLHLAMTSLQIATKHKLMIARIPLYELALFHPSILPLSSDSVVNMYAYMNSVWCNGVPNDEWASKRERQQFRAELGYLFAEHVWKKAPSDEKTLESGLGLLKESIALGSINALRRMCEVLVSAEIQDSGDECDFFWAYLGCTLGSDECKTFLYPKDAQWAAHDETFSHNYSVLKDKGQVVFPTSNRLEEAKIGVPGDAWTHLRCFHLPRSRRIF